MSKKRKAVFLALLAAFLISVNFFTASAYENGEDAVSDLIDILPHDTRDKIEPSLRENKISELLSAEFLTDAFVSCFLGEITDVGSVLCTLLALTVFFALASMIKEGVGSESMGKITEKVLLIVSSLVLYTLFSSGLSRAYTYIEDIKSFQNGLIPIMTGLYFSGGNTSTAISASAGVGASLVIIENLCARTLPVLVKVSFALTLIGAVGSDINYSSLCRSDRNLYMTVLFYYDIFGIHELRTGTFIGFRLGGGADGKIRYRKYDTYCGKYGKFGIWHSCFIAFAYKKHARSIMCGGTSSAHLSRNHISVAFAFFA